jgi:hypothetical protein
VGASDSGVIFHPLSSRKFSPSVSNKECSCEVCHGYHLAKGHKSKAAASEAEVGPPVRTSHLSF